MKISQINNVYSKNNLKFTGTKELLEKLPYLYSTSENSGDIFSHSSVLSDKFSSIAQSAEGCKNSAKKFFEILQDIQKDVINPSIEDIEQMMSEYDTTREIPYRYNKGESCIKLSHPDYWFYLKSSPKKHSAGPEVSMALKSNAPLSFKYNTYLFEKEKFVRHDIALEFDDSSKPQLCKYYHEASADGDYDRARYAMVFNDGKPGEYLSKWHNQILVQREKIDEKIELDDNGEMKSYAKGCCNYRPMPFLFLDKKVRTSDLECYFVDGKPALFIKDHQKTYNDNNELLSEKCDIASLVNSKGECFDVASLINK